MSNGMQYPPAVGKKSSYSSRVHQELRQRIADATEYFASPEVRKKFGEFGYDPLVSLAVTSVTTPDESLRTKCDSELASYYYAKRKAVELSGPDGGEIPVREGLMREILGALIVQQGPELVVAGQSSTAEDPQK